MKTALKTIFLSGLVAGALDCISAVIFLGNMDFSGVWKYVASGYFGKDAFNGGKEMVAYGLLFHFLIAFSWAAVYYFVFRRIRFFTTQIILGGLLYGIIVWIVMNLVVLPFTNIPESTFTAIGVIKNMAILMLCIGLPISLITDAIENFPDTSGK
jgi:uncharacterized membrane protein YagU involved in acid resistance